MTDRYAAMAVPPSDWDIEYWDEPARTISVLEQEAAPIKTGLVDAAGVPIYRLRPPRVVGFCRS